MKTQQKTAGGWLEVTAEALSFFHPTLLTPIIHGRRGGIRTRDLRLRRPTLYPAELLALVEFAPCW